MTWPGRSGNALNMHFHRLIPAIFFLHICILTNAQKFSFDQVPYKNPLQTSIDSQVHLLVKQLYSTAKPPGLIIGISRNGIKKYYMYGIADSVTNKSFTPVTTFEAGSVSKTFTANLVLQFADLKWLDIHQPLLRYIPAQGNDSVLGSILLENILTHSSGLQRLPSNIDKIKGFSASQPYRYTREYLYPYLQALKKPKPGIYNYSNFGFGLLSTILENCTGTSYESLLNRFILQPLKMDRTYISQAKIKTDTATGYFGTKPTPYWEFDCLAGLGAVRTTAEDMLTYLDAHHIPGSNPLLNKAIHDVIQPRKEISSNLRIGYGWHMLENLPYNFTWHNGGTYGFCTFASFEPVTHTSLVVAVNQFGVTDATDKLGEELTRYLISQQ
jgi:CubicO group peptidase (beta-lactamase class C family)